MQKEHIVCLNIKQVLLTSVAGFIGASLVMRLLQEFLEIPIIGIDNMNPYYDISFKEYCFCQIKKLAKAVLGSFQFVKASISDREVVQVLFQIYRPDIVVNLVARACVIRLQTRMPISRRT